MWRTLGARGTVANVFCLAFVRDLRRVKDAAFMTYHLSKAQKSAECAATKLGEVHPHVGFTFLIFEQSQKKRFKKGSKTSKHEWYVKTCASTELTSCRWSAMIKHVQLLFVPKCSTIVSCQPFWGISLWWNPIAQLLQSHPQKKGCVFQMNLYFCWDWKSSDLAVNRSLMPPTTEQWPSWKRFKQVKHQQINVNC